MSSLSVWLCNKLVSNTLIINKIPSFYFDTLCYDIGLTREMLWLKIFIRPPTIIWDAGFRLDLFVLILVNNYWENSALERIQNHRLDKQTAHYYWLPCAGGLKFLDLGTKSEFCRLLPRPGRWAPSSHKPSAADNHQTISPLT